MNDLERSAQLLAGPGLAQAGPDWFSIVDLVRDIVRAILLGEGCRPGPPPEPVELHRYLTQRYTPLQRLFGAERRRQRRIDQALGRWRGDPSKLPAIRARAMTALESGRVTPELIAGVYADVELGR